VLRPHDVVDEIAAEACVVVRRGVVLRELVRAARTDVVLRVLLDLVELEDAEARSLQNLLVDVGRVDARPVVEAGLLEQDRE
jgi:hypothetical protein